MNLYVVTPDTTEYDSYDGAVVLAENTENAILMVTGKKAGIFENWQKPFTVKEIDLSKRQVVLTSYING